MKRTGLCCWLGLVLAVAPSPAAARERAPELALRRFALIASSNDGGPGKPLLRFADSDARAVADVLQHLGGLSSGDLVLLQAARRGSMVASFERLRAAIAESARGGGRREIVVYYSGHSDDTGLLLGGEHVAYPELRSWLDATGADVRIAVLDSCASGALIRRRGGVRRPSFLSDLSVTTRGHAFLTASSADEAAQESDRIGAAFFTHYLVSGLRGAADANGDARVTLAEAYQFAYDETLGRTLQTASGAQHPAYDIQLVGTGDLILTDLRTTSARLVLEESLAGRVYVSDASGRLLIELQKRLLDPIQLGLAPGDYRVVLEREGHRSEASVSLRDGESTQLGATQLAAIEAQPVATRGGSDPSHSSSVAEEETFGEALIGKTSLIGQTREVGGYAGLGFRYAQLGGTDGFIAALEAAVLLNRRYALGLAVGGGFSGTIAELGHPMTTGYAGVVARYHLTFDSPFSVSLGALAGAGGATLDNDDRVDDDSRDDAFFLFEPQLGGHLELTRFARVGIDLGYRVVAGVDRYPASDLRGFTSGFLVQLGWF
jgi:hypothetical protein